MFRGARILVAPLDWGLGHATRCVPIIRGLIRHGATPIIAADSGPMALLRAEFPELEHVRFPGVHIRYGGGNSQLWSMAAQFPAMLHGIHRERRHFERLRKVLRLDAVISDQRFGIRSTELPSILVTHQVFPFTPAAQHLLRRLNLHHIQQFDRCWVMDAPEAPGLAGELSHGPGLPQNARYIGTCSRIEATTTAGSGPYRIVAVISGPEPQRTMLEDRLMALLPNVPGDHLLVRGLPGRAEPDRVGRIHRVPHLAAAELARTMSEAELIVTRSGYTTLMDLEALGRSALIIPTPGQAEQEYLGRLHALTGRFVVQHQGAIDLRSALDKATGSFSTERNKPDSGLEQALKELADMLH